MPDVGHEFPMAGKGKAMTLTTTLYPVNGMMALPSERMAPESGLPCGTPDQAGATAFGRIVALYQSNELLLSALQKVKKNQNSARAYLETSGSNPALAEAYLLQLKAKHSAVLTMLRANRIQARQVLDRPRSGCDALSA
jgi:hypothetical protein